MGMSITTSDRAAKTYMRIATGVRMPFPDSRNSLPRLLRAALGCPRRSNAPQHDRVNNLLCVRLQSATQNLVLSAHVSFRMPGRATPKCGRTPPSVNRTVAVHTARSQSVRNGASMAPPQQLLPQIVGEPATLKIQISDIAMWRLHSRWHHRSAPSPQSSHNGGPRCP